MLLDGKVVTVRVPANSDSLEIRLQKPEERNWMVQLADVFFNGRTV